MGKMKDLIEDERAFQEKNDDSEYFFKIETMKKEAHREECKNECEPKCEFCKDVKPSVDELLTHIGGKIGDPMNYLHG